MTELGACDKPTALDCSCEMFIDRAVLLSVLAPGVCECGHGVLFHTYDVAKG